MLKIYQKSPLTSPNISPQKKSPFHILPVRNSPKLPQPPFYKF